MIKRESKSSGLSLMWVVVVVLAVVFVGPALAQEGPPLDEELQMQGTIEGTGTYFEVTDSEYLNIVFQSSEPVHLTLESVPQMVVMHIEAAEGASSTWITLAGFAPSTTYYKYEDDYHNGVACTTDGSGNYTYAQDLAIGHLVFIQPLPGTMYIPPDSEDPQWWKGWWDGTTLTLQANVSGTIQIDADGVTLDGAGHTVTGSGSGNGVYLNGRTGVTIQNLNVEGFSHGIVLCFSSNNTLTGNTSNFNSNRGIQLLLSSNNNILTGNAANSNSVNGIWLENCTNNILDENICNSNNSYGIYLYNSSDNILTDNTANSNNDPGIFLRFSGRNTLTGNSMSGNRYNFRVEGLEAAHFDNSIDTSNTVDGKPVYYVRNAANQVFDSTTNAGVFYAINCDNITIKDLTLTNNLDGVYLQMFKCQTTIMESA